MVPEAERMILTPAHSCAKGSVDPASPTYVAGHADYKVGLVKSKDHGVSDIPTSFNVAHRDSQRE